MTSPEEQPAPDNSRAPQEKQASEARRPRWLVGVRWLVIVPSLLAAVGLSYAVVHLVAGGGSLASVSSSSTHGKALGSAPADPDATEPMPTFHVPVKATAVTAPRTDALPLPSGLQAEVRMWNAGSGGAALAAVSKQVGDVVQTAGLREYVEMKAACTKLVTDVAGAQAGPPVPDAAMQALYAKALAILASGSRECRAAISENPDGDEFIVTTENQALLRASASSLDSGSKDLYRATAQIVALSRRR